MPANDARGFYANDESNCVIKIWQQFAWLHLLQQEFPPSVCFAGYPDLSLSISIFESCPA